jgi:N-acetylmuramoyl-L-alanine amidase
MVNDLRPDLLISIHANWVDGNPSARGCEVWFSDEGGPSRVQKSQAAAAAVLRSITRNTQVPSRGVKNKDYVILRRTQCPAILVEMEFLSNPQGAEALGRSEFRQRMAESIAEGMVEWAQSSGR